jgi:hypothetical protein
MDPAVIGRVRDWLARPQIVALDPSRIATLARALDDDAAPVALGRGGTVVAYEPGPARRRLLQFDRRGTLIAACRWGKDGALDWAKCLTAGAQWVGLQPAALRHQAWGPSDRVWLLDDADGWAPREALTLFQSLDYARPDFIPPLLEPRRLPPGAGSAILDLIAGLMEDQGVTRVRYRGPYPTEQLFTSLLESFRYDPSVGDPLARFLEGALDWEPTPHERHHVAPGLCIQLREAIEKVVLDGQPFYRTQWQTVVRREPRVVRAEGDRFVCSLWALGRPLQDRLVLDRMGEVLERPPVVINRSPAAPLPPVWPGALAELIARESAPALARSIQDVMPTLQLEWGPTPGDLLSVTGSRITISRDLREAAVAWLRDAPPAEQAARAAVVALEVARLLAPTVRLHAQMRLEEQSAEHQRRAVMGAEPGPALSESVGRLLALIAAGRP